MVAVMPVITTSRDSQRILKPVTGIHMADESA